MSLYAANYKKVKLNDNWVLCTDVIISISSIQKGQSINENILSIFVLPKTM